MRASRVQLGLGASQSGAVYARGDEVACPYLRNRKKVSTVCTARQVRGARTEADDVVVSRATMHDVTRPCRFRSTRPASASYAQPHGCPLLPTRRAQRSGVPPSGSRFSRTATSPSQRVSSSSTPPARASVRLPEPRSILHVPRRERLKCPALLALAFGAGCALAGRGPLRGGYGGRGMGNVVWSTHKGGTGIAL